MNKNAIVLLLILVFSNFSYGQEDSTKNFFPIWSYHQKNINIHGISIGLGTMRFIPRKTNTNGLKIELIGTGIFMPLAFSGILAESDAEFNQLLIDPKSEIINGLSLSTLGTSCECVTNGVSIGTIGQYNFQVNGFSFSSYNAAQIHNGFQLGFVSGSYKSKGLQLSLLANSSYDFRGMQLALINFSVEQKGIQLGLVNVSKKLKGIQIGLWNVNQKRRLPIFNWNFE